MNYFIYFTSKKKRVVKFNAVLHDSTVGHRVIPDYSQTPLFSSYTSKNQRLRSAGDNDRRSNRF